METNKTHCTMATLDYPKSLLNKLTRRGVTIIKTGVKVDDPTSSFGYSFLLKINHKSTEKIVDFDTLCALSKTAI